MSFLIFLELFRILPPSSRMAKILTDFLEMYANSSSSLQKRFDSQAVQNRAWNLENFMPSLRIVPAEAAIVNGGQQQNV